MCVLDREPRTWSAEERQALDDLGHWAEAIFATRQLSQAQRATLDELEQAKQDAMMDPLLHVWNRCAIVDILHREAKRALRHHDPLSVLMVDVDHSDSADDRHGHPTGVEVLKEAARTMRAAIRPYDAVGRYGGEEFLVVLPDSDRTGAAVVAERLRRKIEGLTGAVDSTKRSCKVSTGAAWIEEQSSTHSVDMLVACADNALHLAKLGDGGRTEVEAGEAQSAWRASAEPSPQSDVSPDDNLVGNPLVFATRLERLRACVRDD